MSNIVPQPQITFENNKIYVDSPVDVKYTLDGLDPVFYGVIYTSPISISHTTTIKAISVNSLGEFSNLVAGTFTPESDVSDGSSDSSWIPVTYTYILNPSPGGGADLSNYTTYSYINSYYTSYSYINANYTTFSYLEDKNYATEQYVNDAIDSIEFPEPDLSSYITSDELAQELSSYVTKTELSNQSYLTSIPSEYITQTELSTCGYITASDITIPVIDENIIPKENNTYTLGDSSHLYSATYTSNIYLSEKNGWENVSTWQTRFKLDGNTKYYLTSNRFYPGTNESASLGLSNQRFLDTYTANIYSTKLFDSANSANSIQFSNNAIRLAYNDVGFYLDNTGFRPGTNGNKLLGTSSNKWGATYTSNLYTENVSYTSGKSSIKMNDRNIDIYANNKKMINLSDYGGFVPMKTNVNLGGSSNKWGSTYTADLYADNIHNLIWTGTSAEYAALDNYTTYQIYLIQEA